MAGPYHHPSANGVAPIRIEIAWTRKSLASFMARYQMSRVGALFTLTHLALAFGLLGLSLVIPNFSPIAGCAWLGTTPFHLWGIYLGFGRAGERIWDKNEIFQHPMMLTFTPTSLEIAGHDRKIVRSLDSFRGLRETRRAFLLTMSPDAFYVIPKSAFADDGQRNAFCELVSGGVPKSTPA